MQENKRQDNLSRASPPPLRNAAITRQAILDAARQAFTRSGYDGAGLREIAKNAGVTAKLVNRYFGSKEKLFEEAVEATRMGSSPLESETTTFSTDAACLIRSLAAVLAAPFPPRCSPLDGILMLIRSVSNERATEILRKKWLQNITSLPNTVSDAKAEKRVAMILAVVAGFQFMRHVMGFPVFMEKDSTDIIKYLQAMLEVVAQLPVDTDQQLVFP